MSPYRPSLLAESDITEALAWSHQEFGYEARVRYRDLLRAAIEDVAEDPFRKGSASRPELGAATRTWHLRLSRFSSGLTLVKNPRHFLIYRADDQLGVVIGRVLHERMDLGRHVDEQSWE